jgi:hypothetical protein
MRGRNRSHFVRDSPRQWSFQEATAILTIGRGLRIIGQGLFENESFRQFSSEWNDESAKIVRPPN